MTNLPVFLITLKTKKTMAIVNKCGTNSLDANPWCLSSLFAEGEGDNLLLIQTDVWNALKNAWQNIESTTVDVPTLARSLNNNQIIWDYTLPTVGSGDTINTTLFPATIIGAAATGLNFPGNNLIFNPTIGNAADAEGVPYQKTSVTLPVGSSMNYDELVKYVQSKAWNAIKLNAEKTVINVYGGTRGLYPQADNIAEMMFSGNNDTKGKTSIILENTKANVGIEYIKRGATNTDLTAIANLFTLMQSEACMVNGVNE